MTRKLEVPCGFLASSPEPLLLPLLLVLEQPYNTLVLHRPPQVQRHYCHHVQQQMHVQNQ